MGYGNLQMEYGDLWMGCNSRGRSLRPRQAESGRRTTLSALRLAHSASRLAAAPPHSLGA